MSTGVDAQTCKRIVLDKRIASMTEFKQIIGRGTRINEDYGKLFFTIMDFKRATALFADPAFDGDPVQIYEPGAEDPPVPPEEPIDGGEEPPIDTLVDPPGPLPGPPPVKYYVNSVEVRVATERVQYLDEHGKLITESLKDYSRKTVRKSYASLDAFLTVYYGASGIIDKIDGYLFDKPLLLIGEDGANLINRSTTIAFIARGKYWVNNHAHVLDGISEDFLQFIELHINAINLEKYVTGSAQPKMNQAKMNSIPIALPPLAEQRRIVAKVEQLMALVDALETQLAASRATAANLLSALVAELTAT